MAGVYQDVRPGYGDDLVAAVLDDVGPVTHAVEVAAGTGKGTEAFVRRGLPVHCVEADPRMAAVLRERFPADVVTVEVSRFEAWRPPTGGVPLLLCAQAWHFMDEARRCALAHAALAPGGVVALFGHEYRFVDLEMQAAIEGVYAELAAEMLDTEPVDVEMPPAERYWLTRDLAGSGLFTRVLARWFTRIEVYPTARYLDLAQTFSRFRMLPERRHRGVLAALAEAIDARGGVVRIRLSTALATGRRA